MLFDTTFLIDFEREVKRSQSGRACAFLTAYRSAPLYVSIISVGEFAEGFDATRQHDCWLCLQHYAVLELNRDIAWRAGQLSRQLRSAGQSIGDNDLWIAATALHHGLSLVTGNTAHFQRINGLPILFY